MTDEPTTGPPPCDHEHEGEDWPLPDFLEPSDDEVEDPTEVPDDFRHDESDES